MFFFVSVGLCVCLSAELGRTGRSVRMGGLNPQNRQNWLNYFFLRDAD